MDNNLENKEKFFAQHWGQRVFNNGLMGDNTGWDFTGSNHDDIDGGDFTVLKPLSLITDEDITNISKISICKNPTSIEIIRHEDDTLSVTNVSDHSEWTLFISGIYIYFKCGDSRSEIDSNLFLAVYDYLRLKGYALPFMGLSVEKMIEYGWIKLIS